MRSRCCSHAFLHTSEMAARGVFVAAARGLLASVRGRELLLAAADPSAASLSAPFLRFELLTEAEALPTAAASDANNDEEEKAPTGKRITAVQFFYDDESGKFALLLLVNERQLVHYEVDVAAETLTFRSSRAMPRNSNSLALASVRVGESDKRVVLVSEKTGEAVAAPFPDIARDLKTLLGHTTSMITHMAVTHDSKLLVTADRDEKIRVSQFPRTSIVESYCLGHKASVTRIACLRHDQTGSNLLASTSLDNTIKLWDIASGSLLDSQTLLAESELADDDKALLSVSLAVSPVANVVVVLVNYRTIRVYEVVKSAVAGKPVLLKSLALTAEDSAALTTGEACEATFSNEGKLIVAFKKSPFVQVFDVRLVDGELRITVAIPAENESYQKLRQAASTIELAGAEEEILDELEDGLKKKKVKTEWKARVLGGGK